MYSGRNPRGSCHEKEICPAGTGERDSTSLDTIGTPPLSCFAGYRNGALGIDPAFSPTVGLSGMNELLFPAPPGSFETSSLISGKLDPLSDHISSSRQRGHSALGFHAAFWRGGSCRVRSAWRLVASRIGRESLQGIRRPQSRHR